MKLQNRILFTLFCFARFSIAEIAKCEEFDTKLDATISFIERIEQNFEDVGDAFAGMIGRGTLLSEGKYANDLWAICDVSRSRAYHLNSIVLIDNFSDSDKTNFICVSVAYSASVIQLNDIKKDIKTVKQIIFNAKDPAIQNVATDVRRRLRELETLWTISKPSLPKKTSLSQSDREK